MELWPLILLTLAAAVRAGTPILFAALGELMAERSGVLNLGVEGMMLVGALVGFMTTQKTGEPWLGLLAAGLAGTMVSLIHAFLTITLRANQVVSGLALTIFGTGVSGFLGKPYIGVPAEGFPPTRVSVFGDLPLVGTIFFQHDPMVYLTYPLIPLFWFLLYRTRPGLNVRAVGESPESADAMGVGVALTRYLCVLAGGLLAGLGGAYLSLAYTHMWIENMTAGRGWIALAIVIFGTWDPVRVALGAYLFGGVQALQLRLQALGVGLPTYLLMMTPYVFTVLVLVVATRETVRRRIGAPAALGIPYARGE
ncbi:MAG: ABC transporter permease [candidate division NC10 bacterium]|nr:ABC transporter permease [candidate division NC10 bacterium]